METLTWTRKGDRWHAASFTIVKIGLLYNLYHSGICVLRNASRRECMSIAEGEFRPWVTYAGHDGRRYGKDGLVG